jgi:hypothetical protein
MLGHVVVENDTGRRMEFGQCSGVFQVALERPGIREQPASFECLIPTWIPVGASSYPFTLDATYLACSPQRPQHDLPACLANRQMPPLPPGNYDAQFFPAATFLPTPRAIPVRVTPIISAP